MFDKSRRVETRRDETRAFESLFVCVRTVLSTCALSVAVVFGIKLPRLAFTQSVGFTSAATGLETTALKEWPSIFLE